MNADFVPVALKAGLVNHPPNDEGRSARVLRVLENYLIRQRTLTQIP